MVTCPLSAGSIVATIVAGLVTTIPPSFLIAVRIVWTKERLLAFEATDNRTKYMMINI